MMNSLEYLVKATTKHPKITILIALLITFLALIPTSNFVIDSNVESMFGSDDPDMKMMEEINEIFGSHTHYRFKHLLLRGYYILIRTIEDNC